MSDFFGWGCILLGFGWGSLFFSLLNQIKSWECCKLWSDIYANWGICMELSFRKGTTGSWLWCWTIWAWLEKEIQTSNWKPWIPSSKTKPCLEASSSRINKTWCNNPEISNFTQAHNDEVCIGKCTSLSSSNKFMHVFYKWIWQAVRPRCRRAHAIDWDSIVTILYQFKLQARPILFLRRGDKTFDDPSPNTENQVHYLHQSTSDE